MRCCDECCDSSAPEELCWPPRLQAVKAQQPAGWPPDEEAVAAALSMAKSLAAEKLAARMAELEQLPAHIPAVSDLPVLLSHLRIMPG